MVVPASLFVALLGCGDNLPARPDAGLDVPDAPAAPAQEQTVTSPDGALSLTVRVAGGRPTYAIARAGAPVLAPSGLGLRFQDVAPFEDDLEIAEVERRAVDTTWQPVWGDASEVREHYQELVVHLRERATGRRLDVIARVFDDGVGLRYAVPAQDGLAQVALTEERTEVRFAADGTAWWTPADFEGDESLYREDALSAVADANTPMTVKLGDALYVAVHEADLDDYAAMTLAAIDGAPHAFRSALVPARSGAGNEAVKAELTAPFETPWRTFTIGTTAGALIESHLVLNLNDPCAICDGDTSWIRPSKYMGVWWEIHKGLSTWAPGPNVGATTANTERYMEFAGAHGIPYVLAEGWNVGWEGDWGDMDFTRSHDGFDLEEVVAYGAARGVGFMAHLETGANVAGFEAQIDDAFALYESLGISAIKTGYVGTIAGHHHYSQRMVNHYAEVVRKAAEHRIMVNAHEPIKPTGEHRTYPNFMSREGLRGMEYNAWSAGNPPSHELVLAFTRMLGGPVDYNPGIFDVQWAPERVSDSPFFGTAPTRVHSTRARQLALYVILLSGVQMVTDVPENYEGQPELAFIEDVPVTWDETRVIHGEIGRYITVARRSGGAWYLGSGTDATPRVLEIPLDFLGSGAYVAETYTDAADADFDEAPNRVAMHSVLVTSSDTLVATMEAGGGQAVRLRPASAGDMSAVPMYRKPAFTVAGVTVPDPVVVDDFVMVTAELTNTGNLVGGEAVSLRVGGQEVASRLVRLAAGQRETVTFEIQPTAVGPVEVAVGSASPVRVTVVGRDQAPAAPASLRVTDVSGSAIGLAWSAVPGASGYRIYRHGPDDIYGAVAHAEVDGAATTFTDRDDVTLGARYFYIVRAVHGDGTPALSPASNQVETTATARLVAVTLRVRVPDETPPSALVFVPGSIDALGPWNPGLVDMSSQGGGVWAVTIDVPEQTSLQYKYTRGNWETVEWWGAITGTTNRVVVVDGSQAAMLVDNTSTDFGDAAVPDTEKGVQRWRDPLVTATSPASGASVTAPATIEVTFSRDVTAPADGYGGAVQVTRNGAAVAGTVAEPDPGRLVFTPGAQLGSGTYDVRVSSVLSALGGDSVPMQAAYTFSFTVP
jgi:alpha-glucosidase